MISNTFLFFLFLLFSFCILQLYLNYGQNHFKFRDENGPLSYADFINKYCKGLRVVKHKEIYETSPTYRIPRPTDEVLILERTDEPLYIPKLELISSFYTNERSAVYKRTWFVHHP